MDGAEVSFTAINAISGFSDPALKKAGAIS
jgi:hypothetical protein